MKRLWNLATLPVRKKPTVGTTPADAVHRENKWQLLRYRARPAGATTRTPIVLVPSLINRHYVLDLMPGKSFAEYLVHQGHDVFVLDWGRPGPEDRWLSFEDVVDRYLGRALRAAARTAEVERVHVLGYCMGGTLAAIHAAAHPERFASFVALAAPVEFTGEGLLGHWTRTDSFDLRVMVDAFGNVPWQLMQSAFHMLRPTMNLAKATYLLEKAWDDAFLDGFLAIETWANDNVSLPGEFYRRYIEDLYRGDLLARGELRLAGRRVDLGAIDCPTLAVSFRHDHIVPWKSAAALTERVSSADVEHRCLPGGHVGAVVSRQASKGLWPDLSTYFAARDDRGVLRAPRLAQTNAVRIAARGAAPPPTTSRDKTNGGTRRDAGARDAATIDAGTRDAATIDAGTRDAGTRDAATIDAGTRDAATRDAGTRDAGTRDAATIDVGTRDAATIDAAKPSAPSRPSRPSSRRSAMPPVAAPPLLRPSPRVANRTTTAAVPVPPDAAVSREPASRRAPASSSDPIVTPEPATRREVEASPSTPPMDALRDAAPAAASSTSKRPSARRVRA